MTRIKTLFTRECPAKVAEDAIYEHQVALTRALCAQTHAQSVVQYHRDALTALKAHLNDLSSPPSIFSVKTR